MEGWTDRWTDKCMNNLKTPLGGGGIKAAGYTVYKQSNQGQHRTGAHNLVTNQ